MLPRRRRVGPSVEAVAPQMMGASVQGGNGGAAVFPRWSFSSRGVGYGYSTQVLLTSAPLVLSDLLALALSLLLSSLTPAGGSGLLPGVDPLPLRLALSGLLVVMFTLLGLYPGTGLNPVIELKQTSLALTLLFAPFILADFLHGGGWSVTLLTSSWLLSLMLVPLLRFSARAAASRCNWWGQPAMVMGNGAEAIRQYEHFRTHPQLGLRPVAPGDAADRAGSEDCPDPARAAERAAASAGEKKVFWAIVALPAGAGPEARLLINRHTRAFPHVLVVAPLAELPTLWNHSWECGGRIGIEMNANLLKPHSRVVKRVMDILIATVAGAAFLPLIVVLAVLMKLTFRGPVFYSQERIGEANQRFRIWKFRTMVVNADRLLKQVLATDPRLREEWQTSHKLRRDFRITPVGRFLRKTSLDEIPQLWNVLRGEMSIVGPRPIVDDEVPKYAVGFELYTKVRPGITGLWQVSGRNGTSYEERVRLDAYYVSNWSPWLDVYVLALTTRAVLRCKGAQ